MKKPLSPTPVIYATLRSIALWVGCSLVLSLSGLWLTRRLVPISVLRSSADALGNYLQTLGTIYAVLLAFVVFVVWQQFNDARSQVEREAHELLDLVRTVRGLPQISRPFLEQAAAYVQVVLLEEWPLMAAGSQARLDHGTQILDRLWNILVVHEPASECHKSLYEEALARFNELSDTRMCRLSSSRLRIPLALRLVLYFGAITTVGSMWLFSVESFAVHAIMTGALAGSISHVLYVISDLDDCFNGNWQVPRSAFESLGEYLAAAQVL